MEGEDSLLYRHLLVVTPTLCWDQNAAAVLEHLSMGQSLGKITSAACCMRECEMNSMILIYSASSFPNVNHYRTDHFNSGPFNARPDTSPSVIFCDGSPMVLIKFKHLSTTKFEHCTCEVAD